MLCVPLLSLIAPRHATLPWGDTVVGDRGRAGLGGVSESEVVKELRLLRVEQREEQQRQREEQQRQREEQQRQWEEQQKQRTQVKVPVRFWAHRRGDSVYAFSVSSFADLHDAVGAEMFGGDRRSGDGGGGESDEKETVDDYGFYYLANRAEGIDSRSELKDEATFKKFKRLYNLPTVFLYRRTPSAESPIENPQHMERADSSVHSSSDAEGSTRGHEQARFREFLEERDGYQCVVTGKRKVRNSNNVVAAHVVGVKCSVEDRKAAGVYKQEYANVNGMLLDAKWHAAFDSYLWCPDRDAVIHLSSEIMDNDEYVEFRPFAGRSLRFQEPLRPSQPRPTPDVLAHRFVMYVRECGRAGRDPN